MKAHKHGDGGTRMRRFHGYPWKQNKNAYTSVWGKQIKAGCYPSILQIHGSSEKNEYSLVFSKHSYEAPAPPLCNKLNTRQTFHSNAVAKVLFGVEQMLNHSKIRHDLPRRLCPQAHYEVPPLLSLCRHMSLCSHCERKVVADGECTNGCLCSEKLVWWCCSLSLGQYICTIALLKSELSPMNLSTQT